MTQSIGQYSVPSLCRPRSASQRSIRDTYAGLSSATYCPTLLPHITDIARACVGVTEPAASWISHHITPTGSLSHSSFSHALITDYCNIRRTAAACTWNSSIRGRREAVAGAVHQYSVGKYDHIAHASYRNTSHSRSENRRTNPVQTL